MLKLKKIIQDLHSNDYSALEENLIRNKADNFLHLFQAYRHKSIPDQEIIRELNINSNSFYVLKSRLYTKIQDHLSGNIYSGKEETLKLLHQVPEICRTNSREVAVALLEKLEKDLLQYDMHNELLVVYSALKRLHVYSQKYFHYSQLFNKHIAFSLSLEKSEEILGNFSRFLGQYLFSKSQKIRDTLLFIRKDISDHHALNTSRQIEIIKNLIDIQLVLFCHTELGKEINVEERLNYTLKLINELPGSSPSKSYSSVMDFLYFEYYFRAGQLKQAAGYYEKVNDNAGFILLQTNACLTSLFFISRIRFVQETGRIEELLAEGAPAPLVDPDDTCTAVLLGIYYAMVSYYKGNYKDSANRLNEIINNTSFKDYFHIQVEVKLTLAFVYLAMKEKDMADNIIKNIYRKIKAESLTAYQNVLDLIKVFGMQVKQADNKVNAKQKDHFTLFLARNTGENAVLSHLLPELKNKYNP